MPSEYGCWGNNSLLILVKYSWTSNGVKAGACMHYYSAKKLIFHYKSVFFSLGLFHSIENALLIDCLTLWQELMIYYTVIFTYKLTCRTTFFGFGNKSVHLSFNVCSDSILRCCLFHLRLLNKFHWQLLLFALQ